MLYIVSTPIGNIKDITIRAIEVLKEVELILAEDTRRTSILLTKYDIKKRMTSFNRVNEKRKTGEIIDMLNKDARIALVSDSGTPCISDPGFYLVQECIKSNIQVCPVPGPSSILASLVCSGLTGKRFTFFGFIPKKEKKKRELMEEIRDMEGTLILFESPYRIKKTVDIMAEMLGERKIVLAREITKMHEEFIRGTPKTVSERIGRGVRGEIVILIEGKNDNRNYRR